MVIKVELLYFLLEEAQNALSVSQCIQIMANVVQIA